MCLHTTKVMGHVIPKKTQKIMGDRMLNEYFAHLTATGKSENTIKTYRRQLTQFFQWLEKNSDCTDPKSITSIDAVEYRRYLQDVKGLKPASINTALATIEAFCVWMQKQGYITHNPLADVKRVEQVQEAPKWLSKNEKYRVIRAALNEKNKRNGAIILTLLMAGLRAEELINLRPEDVLISERKGSIVVRAGKGNKRRVVPIPNDLRKCLAEYLVTENATGTWLFPSQRAEKLTYDGLYNLCVSIGKKAKVEGLTPHVLRHTYGHDLVTSGVRIDVVAKLMGHSKIDTTLIYTQPGEEELQNAVEAISFT
jgi:site-specific recombinase XerD